MKKNNALNDYKKYRSACYDNDKKLLFDQLKSKEPKFTTAAHEKRAITDNFVTYAYEP
jgi:hypothetical protein